MSHPEMPTEAGNTTCVPLLDHNIILHISIAPAVCIIILLSVLHGKRTSNKHCCVWRPGAVVPLNFLDGYNNRWSLAAAFGAISTRIPQLLFGSVLYRNTVLELAPTWVRRTLLILLAVMECTIAFFPLFACILSPFRLVASTLGLLYSIFWLVVQLIYVFSCPLNHDNDSLGQLELDYNKLILQWPFCFLFAFLCLSFACTLWKCLTSRTYRWEKPEPIAASHQKLHVRYLFRKPSDRPKLPKATEYEGLLDTFRYSTYPGFRYPSRMLCILSISLTLAYQVFVEMLVEAIQTAQDVAKELPAFIVRDEIDQIIKTSLIILTACIWITSAFLVLLMLSNLFLIFKNYRSHFIQLCQADKTFAARAVAFCSSSELVVCSMRYAGYQIAYFISGYIIFTVAVLLILFVVMEGLFVFFFLFGWDGLLWLVEFLVVPLVFNVILYYVQVFGSRIFFLQPRTSPDQPIPLALRNMRSLETMNFVTFFHNITIGLMSSVKRTLQTMLLGLVIICRIDRSPFNRSFERFDRGLKAYIGMLYVDYTHNHPVLRVFCSILLKEDKGVIHSIISTLHNISPEHAVATEKKKNSPAKRRWHLAYTLISNPQLISRRKHQIGLAAKEIPFATECVDGQALFVTKDHEREIPLEEMYANKHTDIQVETASYESKFTQSSKNNDFALQNNTQ